MLMVIEVIEGVGLELSWVVDFHGIVGLGDFLVIMCIGSGMNSGTFPNKASTRCDLI